MTLPSFINAGTAQWIASNNTPIPSMSPGNGNVGDLLLLILERNDTTAAPTVSGWTNIAAATGTNSTTQSSAVYWKIATSATGTSDATGTVTFGTSTTARGGVVLRFRDTSAVAPVHGTPTLANVASTATTVNATNFSTTVNNCIAVFVASMIGARSTTNTTTNWTAGTGVTAFASQQTSLGNDLTIGYGEKTFATLGSLLTPGIVWSTNTTTGVGQGILIALREVFVPNTPTSSVATSIANTSFTANWSAPSTDSTHDAATGYQLDVATDNAFSSLVVGYNNLDVGNVTSKSVTGLSDGTQYYYRVRAYNNNATASGNSTTQTPITTLGASTTSAASSITTTGFTANWSSVTGATGYTLDVDSRSDFGGASTGGDTVNAVAEGNVTSKAITGLSVATLYYYRVRATTSAATAANSNTTSVTTARPPAPTDTYGSAVYNTSGLVAYWRLDESSGKAIDSMGTHDATTTSATQGATGLLTGNSDTAYSFNGTSNSVSVPFSSALNPASTFSFECWFQITGSGATQYFAYSRDGSNHGWELRYRPSNGAIFLDLNVSTAASIAPEVSPESGPHHLAVTYDGTSARFYYDGVLKDGPTTATYTANGSQALVIGLDAGIANYFGGTIDEVALYNVALDQATISDHYNKGIGYFAEISGMPDGHRGQVQMHQLLAQ